MYCHGSSHAIPFRALLSAALLGFSLAWVLQDKMEQEARDYHIHVKNDRTEMVEATVATTRFHSTVMPMFKMATGQELIWEVNFKTGDKVACAFCWRGEDRVRRFKQFTLLNDLLNHPKYRQELQGVENYQYFNWTLTMDGLSMKNTEAEGRDFQYDLNGATVVNECRKIVLDLQLA